MRDIKNADGRLVAKLDEQADIIVIKLKGYETKIVVFVKRKIVHHSNLKLDHPA